MSDLIDKFHGKRGTKERDEHNEFVHQMISDNFRKQWGTNGEVSRSADATLTLADGTVIETWAYKLSDSHKPDFYIAIEKINNQ